MRLLTPILLNQKPKLWSLEWFNAWQMLLLIALNSPIKGLREDVRNRLGINIDRQIKIDQLCRNSFRIKTGKDEYSQSFYVKPEFAFALQREWAWLWKTIHRWDMNFANIYLPRLNFGFDTLTKYPDAHPETNTTDGFVRRTAVDETFATIRAGSGNDFSDSAVNEYPAGLISTDTSNQFYMLFRSIFLFDTSALDDGCTKTSANIYLYVSNYATQLGNDTNCITSVTPASNTALQASDYENAFGATEYSSSRYNINNIGIGYKTLALNAAGLAAIPVDGITKIGLRSGWDFDNSFGGSWAGSYVRSTLTIYFSDTSTTAYKPRLDVTFTLPTNIGKQDVQNSMTQIRM